MEGTDEKHGSSDQDATTFLNEGWAMTEDARKTSARPAKDTDADPTIPAHHAENLTKGGQCALIRLHDATYMLRITRHGKLILTK